MPPKKKPSSPKLSTPIEAVKHADKRANIPTEELRDFIADEEKAPKTILYPRDPSLDPQLVWKGKDEQDAQDLAVPAVPIYIQEHIKPQAIIDLVRRKHDLSRDYGDYQPTLFADFNELPFEDRVDFYHHEQSWSNRMILGDSLMVMTSLAEKEGLKGKVQMIYFDPPYGIKFGSNWQVSTRKRDVKDGKAEDATRQPEQVKAFRDTWQLGIHSYLSYLRDRLTTARELLTETGSIFVQIGDENVHLVRSIMDEVFGSSNFVCMISVQKAPYATSTTLAPVLDYLLWYAKDVPQLKYRTLYKDKSEISSIDLFRLALAEDGQTYRTLTKDEMESGVIQDKWKRYRLVSLISQGAASESQPFVFNGEKYYPPASSHWKVKTENLQRVGFASRIQQTPNSIQFRGFIDDFPISTLNNIWTDTITGSFMEDKVYVVQTNPKIIERCMLMTTDPGDLVLDPTCGSGTTAYVAEQWGRRWITIDTSRVAIALARTRLMSGRYPYYLLADSPEGRKKEAELGSSDFSRFATTEVVTTIVPMGDIKKGFVYERVPHITLKSIANNEEIDEIHAKYQPELERLRGEINKAAKQKWEEWEIPRAGAGHDSPLLEKYWELRRARQKEIDASIARRADTEFLYDKPYQDNKRLRVSGPFTVESLSPHRVLAPDDPATAFREDALNTRDFTQMILENLKAAGVQNTVKNQRLKFDSLEPYAGTWIQAVGEYTEKDGKPRRAAISIGPELGTVSAEQVKEAAKEAVLGVGFDLLIVCGFAFDPHVSEEAKRYGKLTVLIARMNPDLAMGDDLLKKTGAGNLFMVFGEPDVEIHRDDGSNDLSRYYERYHERYYVVLKGLDVYDPTTGEIRSNSTDDIACWFLDTDYNGESFIVRHAYFTGADQPYDKLKRALRAEIDESAWSALYRTESIPFEKPSTGKIAVKVINHYGDEALKVFETR
ncbi:MAG: site-specific DNA-methyltransferase [Anaerolineales bacterium]|jgi:adenine-specific DNA-methyltransferase|nr:site-specific DNA-methyltransferase [Anaerolineales bacterium]GER80472.1 site-specific DNA-methyltransferase [Candidatus Denitrolinea symbiosum]